MSSGQGRQISRDGRSYDPRQRQGNRISEIGQNVGGSVRVSLGAEQKSGIRPYTTVSGSEKSSYQGALPYFVYLCVKQPRILAPNTFGWFVAIELSATPFEYHRYLATFDNVSVEHYS